jgi:hypothetical protein
MDRDHAFNEFDQLLPWDDRQRHVSGKLITEGERTIRSQL